MMFEVAGKAWERYELKKRATEARRLVETLQCDWFRILVKLLQTLFVEHLIDLNIMRLNFICLTKFT